MPRNAQRRLSAWTTKTVAQAVVQAEAVEIQAFANSRHALHQMAAELLPDAIVFDPGVSADAAAAIDELYRLRTQFPATPVIVYGQLTRTLARVVTDLARDAVAPVVLLQAFDGPARLDRTINKVAFQRASERVLLALRDCIRLLPPPLTPRVEDLFRRPQLYRTIDELVRDAGVSRRHVYRQLASAGFPAGKDLLLAARMGSAFEDLKDVRMTLGEVADRAGYEDHGTFARHMRRVVGVLPRAVRIRMSADEFVRRVAETALGRHYDGPRRLLTE